MKIVSLLAYCFLNYQSIKILISSLLLLFFCCKLLVCVTVGWLVAVVYTQEQPEIKAQANAGAFQILT